MPASNGTIACNKPCSKGLLPTIVPFEYLNCSKHNYAYRILHGIPRWVSAREAQVANHIYTFDALLRKNAYSFVERYRFSKKILITALMNSSAFLESWFYVHYPDFLLPVVAQ